LLQQFPFIQECNQLSDHFRIDDLYLESLVQSSTLGAQTWRLDAASTISTWVSQYDCDRGYIGLCRSHVTDLAQRKSDYIALIDKALLWFRDQDVKKVYAPVDVSTWFDYRLKIVTTTHRSFSWEPETDTALNEALQDTGFHAVAHYHSTGFESTRFDSALSIIGPSYQRALDLGFSIDLMSQSAMRERLPQLFDLAVRAFDKAFLYEPLELESFLKLYAPKLSRPNPDNLSFILRSPSDDLVGFIYAFVDQDLAVVKTVATKGDLAKEYKFGKYAPSLALLYAVLNEAKRRNLNGGVSALVYDHASSTAMERFQTWAQSWRHEYHLYSNSLQVS